MKKLKRTEMKILMGGVDETPIDSIGECAGNCDYTWEDYQGRKHKTPGTCKKTEKGNLCYCSNGVGNCN